MKQTHKLYRTLYLLMIVISTGCTGTNKQDIKYSPCKTKAEEKSGANQLRTAANMNRFMDCENQENELDLALSAYEIF